MRTPCPLLVAPMTLLLACAPVASTRPLPPTPPTTTTTTTTTTGTTGTTGDTGVPCPTGLGSACDPLVIDVFPYVDHRDTSDGPTSAADRYGCAPDVDEGGPEWWYVVHIPEDAVLTAGIDEIAGDGIDVDVHLLSAPDPDACVARDHERVTVPVTAGTYWLVLDTWVDADGVPQAGPYDLTVDLLGGGGSCEVVPTDVRMFWSACDASVSDCFTSAGSVFLRTPTVGPVVKEAHLVTTADGFGSGWPTSFTDGIARHYANSEAATGYVMNRTEPWAPAGEGGSEYGQGATGAKLPVVEEAWTINMYWRDRPTPGTRMLVRNPANGRAVVAAAGYETGPGDNAHVAGVSEEIHDWLGTSHLDDLQIGFLADGTLPFGPITCP
ncbi:MAG: hypothetical protein H6735_20995 [Alphaproteobacteria bacterium]|nr:hypothetical protein [Alphaproteobacteria bacterium]